MIERVDDSDSAEVVASGTINGAVFVQGTNLIAFDRILEDDDPITAELVLLDRIAGDERVLLRHEVQPISIFPSPSGKRLFVGMSDSDVDYRYFDVDLDTREVTELTEIAGLNAFGPTGGRWKLALAMNDITNGNAPTPGYYAVDLNAGTVANLAPITLDTGVTVTQPLFDSDGIRPPSARCSVRANSNSGTWTSLPGPQQSSTPRRLPAPPSLPMAAGLRSPTSPPMAIRRTRWSKSSRQAKANMWKSVPGSIRSGSPGDRVRVGATARRVVLHVAGCRVGRYD